MSKIPIGGFAICSITWWPPMLSVPPTGTIENVISAGTRTRYGANLKTKRSASAGIRSSLKNNLIPSASVWRSPNGPQRCGPMRLCMSEIAFRSNQIIKITEPMSAPKPTRTLIITMRITTPVIPWLKSGSVEASNEFIGSPVLFD